MKIRIVSDLHIDINKKMPLAYQDDVFTVICGDISGYAEDTIEWVKDNIRQGVFVEGNHIAYQGTYTIQQSHEQLEACFPLDEPVSYLNNSHKAVGDVVFVGSTLWTDFRLPCAGVSLKASNQFYFPAKMVAALGMNDYRQKLDEKHYLTPDDTERFFYTSLLNIKRVCEQFPNKKIVVVTHHAPSAKSLDDRYGDNALNPCYASDLEQFILEHPNIRLWCHGHIHQSKDYRIGETRVICNPRGYEAVGEVNPSWDRDLILEV